MLRADRDPLAVSRPGTVEQGRLSLADVESDEVSTRRLHHVGIVVPTEDQAIQFMSLLGLREAYRGFVDPYEALCVFTQGNGGSPIEFVIPTGGVLTQYNRGMGGLHHVALVVDSLESVTQQYAAKGIRLLEDQPVQGAGPFLCNFLPPVYTRGVIVEFIEELDPDGR